MLLLQRHVDLIDVGLIFEGWVATVIDDRKDYGEIRYRSVGMVGKDCYVVVWTVRNNGMRLITAWKGGTDEKGRYKAGFARRNPGDA